MSSSDGVRRFKTYGKHKSRVAVSRREWWSTVSDGAASTSTARVDRGTAASPSCHAGKKGSSAVGFDDEEDTDYEQDEFQPPAPSKKLARVQRKPTNNRPCIVDLSSKDSDEEDSTSAASIVHTKPTVTPVLDSSVPASSRQARRRTDQQAVRGRVISLSDSEEEDIIVKPLRRKAAIPAELPASHPKRTIIVDSPLSSPSSVEHVEEMQEEEVSAEAAPMNAVRVPTPSEASETLKTTVLTLKDSNLAIRHGYAALSPVKKATPPGSLSPKKSTVPPRMTSSGCADVSKYTTRPSSASTVSLHQHSTPAKPALLQYKNARQPLVSARLISSTTTSRSTSSSSVRTSSTKSSSSAISLPPPRGHHAESVVSWRRPLVTISAVRPQNKVSTLSSIARKTDTASPMPVRAVVPVSAHHGRATHVVVEVPFGLPRSRSPATRKKEPRSRQTSSHSTTSVTSGSASEHVSSPLASAVETGLSFSSPALADSAMPASCVERLSGDKLVSHNSLAPSTTIFRTSPLTVSSVAPIPSTFASLLEHCDAPDASAAATVGDFESFVSEARPLFSKGEAAKPRWTKLGEATFSEVFIVTNSDKADDVGIVVKVIPLHMTPQQAAEEEKVEEAFAKNEQRVDEAFTTTIEDLAREIRIFRSLSRQEEKARKGWPGFKGAYLVQGAYPSELLSAWDAYKAANPRRAENPKPDTFAANQVFALICMEHAGTDLETVKIKRWSEAAAILWQVGLALSAAEESLQFEHRDLHWGNILVKRQANQEDVQAASLDEQEYRSDDELPVYLAQSISPISATIIDFTLSRACVPKSTRTPKEAELETLSGGFDDEWMFTGEGDYQYECYRIMKRLVQNDWERYQPVTNIVWLHYLVKKLIHGKGLKKPTQRVATRSKAIKATLPGTPRRPRTRTMAISTKGSSKSSGTPSDSEKLSYDSLVAAEVVLGEAITAALKSLRRSTSLTQMMDSLRINSEPEVTSGKLACAGDFVEWWRRL